MIQTDVDLDRHLSKAIQDVRPIGDIMPDVLALHGLLEVELEIQAELVTA